MSIALVVLFIAVYLVFEVMVARDFLNLHWALLGIALVILIVCTIAMPGQITLADWQNVVSGGVTTYTGMMITFTMYGIFGGFLYEYGVVNSMVNWAVKISRNMGPMAIMIIFTIIGAVACLGGGTFVVIMIGVELFMALGISKAKAAGLSVMIIADTYYFTVSYYSVVETTTGITQMELLTPAIVMSAIMFVANIICIIVTCRIDKPQPNEEMVAKIAQDESEKKVYKFTYILPFVPVVLILALQWNAMFAFLISFIITIVVCSLGHKFSLKGLADISGRSFKKGVGDASGLITILICVGVLVSVVSLEPVTNIFVDFMSVIMPSNPVLLIILFCALTLLGVPFRGIGATMGMGIGILVAMMAMPGISPMFVAVMMMALNMSGLVICPLTGSCIIAQNLTETKPVKFLTTQWMYNAIPLVICVVYAVVVCY